MKELAPILILMALSATTFSQEPWTVPEEAKNRQATIDLSDENAIRAGEKLFGSACWTCHGESGEGNGLAAVELETPPSNLTSTFVQKQSDGTLFWKISYGRDQMANYEYSLSEEERWQLVAFIRTLAKEYEQ